MIALRSDAAARGEGVYIVRNIREKLWSAAVVGGLIAAGALFAPAAASADENSEIYDHVYGWYVDHGVAPETAKGLALGYLVGDMPDSSDPNAVPVSTETTRVGAWLITIRKFNDGSVTESRIEAPIPTAGGGLVGGRTVAPNSVGSCYAVNTGSGYVSYIGCRVEESSSFLVISFRADYTRNSGGTGAISAVNSPYVWAAGGTAPTPTLTITRALSSGASYPATAQAATTFSTPFSSGQVYVYLKVTGASATSSRSGF